MYHCYYLKNEKHIPEFLRVPLPLSEKRKTFFQTFIPFFDDALNSVHFEKRDPIYKSNIWEVNDSGKCAYMNARKLLFQSTLRESTCSRVLNTADTTMAGFLLELSIDPTHTELEKICVSEI